MNLNIHPIFVHFPVALLTVYSVLELLRFKQFNTRTFFYIKATFVIFGALSLLGALGTGDYGIPLHQDVRNIIEIHERFADFTTVIFWLLAGNYIVQLINEFFADKITPSMKGAWNFIEKIRSAIFKPSVVVILALIGLIVITITGSLGGYIAYGPGNDPVTDTIAKLIIK